MERQVIDWKNLFKSMGKKTIEKFANGTLSGRQLYEIARGTDVGGIVRNLIRPVSRGRTLAKKALSR